MLCNINPGLSKIWRLFFAKQISATLETEQFGYGALFSDMHVCVNHVTRAHTLQTNQTNHLRMTFRLIVPIGTSKTNLLLKFLDEKAKWSVSVGGKMSFLGKGYLFKPSRDEVLGVQAATSIVVV